MFRWLIRKTLRLVAAVVLSVAALAVFAMVVGSYYLLFDVVTERPFEETSH